MASKPTAASAGIRSSPSLDVTSYPHIFDAILAASLTSPSTLQALRSLCHAARDAVEAKLARHVVVKSHSTRDGKFLELRSALGRVVIPGVRVRNYVALAAGSEDTAMPPRVKTPVPRGTGMSPAPPLPGDVTRAQAAATIARVLSNTRVLDVGDFVSGKDVLALAPWLRLDVVRLPSYRLAGANNDNPTLPARTVVLSSSAQGALRSSYALVVPDGTERFVSHEFTDIAPGTWAIVNCRCRGSWTARPTCACNTVKEVVVAFIQRKPSRGTSELEFGYTPQRVAELCKTFPKARVILVGAEGARLGRDPPVQRPYLVSNDEIKRLIVEESEHAATIGHIECFKLAEWKKRVGVKRWDVEMGLGDTQVLNRA